MRSLRLRSADEEKATTQSRRIGGSCTGNVVRYRGEGDQACKAYCGGIVSCSSSRLWYRPAASGPFPPQLSHPHRSGAVGTATAAAPAAPDGAMETGGSHSTVRLPAPPAGKPRARAAALSLPMCAPMCAPMRTARTHILHPTALWGRLLRRLLLHRSCAPRRPRSSLPRRSGRCLPAAAPARRMRTRTPDRPSTRLRLQSDAGDVVARGRRRTCSRGQCGEWPPAGAVERASAVRR